MPASMRRAAPSPSASSSLFHASVNSLFSSSGSIRSPRLLFTRIDDPCRIVHTSVLSFCLLPCIVGGVSTLDEVGEFSKVYELIADDLVMVIQGDPGYIAFCHLKITGHLLPEFRTWFLPESEVPFQGLPGRLLPQVRSQRTRSGSFRIRSGGKALSWLY